jgi:hypothetical protein
MMQVDYSIYVKGKIRVNIKHNENELNFKLKYLNKWL